MKIKLEVQDDLYEKVGGETTLHTNDSKSTIKEEIFEETLILNDVKDEIFEEPPSSLDCNEKPTETPRPCLKVCSFAREIPDSSPNDQLPHNQNILQDACVPTPGVPFLIPGNINYVQAPNLFYIGGLIVPLGTNPMIQFPVVTQNGNGTLEPVPQQEDKTESINEKTKGKTERKPIRKKTISVQKNKTKAHAGKNRLEVEDDNDDVVIMETDIANNPAQRPETAKIPAIPGVSNNDLPTIKMENVVKSKLELEKNQPSFRCDICWFETKFEWVFENHSSEHSILRPPNEEDVKKRRVNQYKCRGCSQIFRLLPQTFSHIELKHMRVTNSKIFCKICNNKVNPFKRKAHMRKHIKARYVSSTSDKTCRFCKRILKSGLKRHLSLVHKYAKMYMCNKCYYETPDELLFLNHKLRHEPKRGDYVNKRSCPICNKQFFDRNALNRHVLSKKGCEISKDVQFYRCVRCSFYTKSMLKLHFHVVDEHVKKNRKLRCRVCDFQTIRVRILGRHMLTHVGSQRMLKCDKCFYQTEHRRLFRFHLANHTKRILKTIPCKICPYRASNLIKLERHVEAKHWYKCKNCSFLTNNRKYFWRHKCTSNNTVEKYKCNNCDFVTSSKVVYRKHTDRKKRLTYFKWLKCRSLNCRLCSFVGSCRFTFLEHITGHLSDKTHFCDLCKYRVVQLTRKLENYVASVS